MSLKPSFSRSVKPVLTVARCLLARRRPEQTAERRQDRIGAPRCCGLTVPAILVISLFNGQGIVLGLDPAGMVLTLVLNLLTFTFKRTTVLHGAMHLVVFFVYITSIFNP